MLTLEQEKLLERRLTVDNIERVKASAKIIIVIEIFMLIWFYYKYKFALVVHVSFYSSLLVVSIGLLFSYKYLEKKDSSCEKYKIQSNLMIFYYHFLLYWAAIFTVYEQTLTGHVTTYLTNMMIVSVLFVTNKKRYYIMQMLPFLLVVYGFTLFQTSLNITQAHTISIITFGVFATLGSRLVYRMYVRMFIQEQELQLKNDKLKVLTEHFEKLSTIDDLTQLPNRRGLTAYLSSNCINDHQPIGVLVLDVDSFKAYNDHYGHLKGNEILATIAEVIKDEVAYTNQFAARFGGEEFVIVTSQYSEEQIYNLANAIRNKIELLQIEHEKSSNHQIVTVSIGYAVDTIETIEDFKVLMNQADEALYEAKSSNKNCVVSFNANSLAKMNQK